MGAVNPSRARRVRGALWVAVTLVALLTPVGLPSHHDRPTASAPTAMGPGPTGPEKSSTTPMGRELSSGRLLNGTVSPLAGVAENNVLAIDSAHQVAYSLDRGAGLLVEFDIATGQLLRYAPLVPPGTLAPSAIAFDPADGTLFIAVTVPPGSGTPYVLVLNASTFQTVANVTQFTGVPGFDPLYLLYDAASGMVLAENASNADTAVIDPVSDTVRAVVGFPCGPCFAQGFVDVSDHGYVLLPDGRPTVPAVDPFTASAAAGLSSPSPTFLAGVGAYDPSAGRIYLTNSSLTGDLEVFAPNGSYLGAVSNGPEDASAAAYLPTGDLVVFSNDSGATSPGGWELYVYRGSTGALTQHYANPAIPPWETGYSFSDLEADPSASPEVLLSAGVGNASVRFSVNATTGQLAPGLAYSGYPGARWSLRADPLGGRLYALDETPAEVEAYSLASGAHLWTLDLTHLAEAGGITGFAFDASQSDLYLAFGSAGVNVYSTADGSPKATIPLPGPVEAIAVDGTHHLLYAASPAVSGGLPATNLTVVNTSANVDTVDRTVLWNVSTCGLVALPALDELAAAGCDYFTATQVEIYSAAGVPRASFMAGPAAYLALTADSDGTVFAPSYVDASVTVFDPPTEQYGANWSLGAGFGTIGSAVDLADGLGLATSGSTPDVELVSLATGSVVGTYQLPTPSHGLPDFAPTTGSFYVPLYFTGQVLTAGLAPVPGVATGVTVTPGNTTLSVQWGAAPAPSAYPVLNYSVLVGPSTAGPWAVAASALGTSTTLTGLADGVTYSVSVEATSAAGPGLGTAPVNGTPRGVPYPPQSLSATSPAPTVVDLAWVAPSRDDGSPVTLYVIESAATPAGPWTPEGNTTGLTLSVPGLAPGTGYAFEVLAANAVGISHPSVPVSVTTGSLAPPPAPNSTGNPSPNLLLPLAVGVALLVVASVAAWLVLGRRASGGEPPSEPPEPPA